MQKERERAWQLAVLWCQQAAWLAIAGEKEEAAEVLEAAEARLAWRLSP